MSNKYNLDAIKEKLNALSSPNKKNANGETKAKINWWKPEIGTHEVRFLPILDKEGNRYNQPFYEVAYYDHKDLSDKRFVSPTQFGMPDPLKEMHNELAKDRSKEAWLVKKKLTPKERYYAAIVVRGEGNEEKGLQLWELSPKLCKDIYTLLVSPDYQDEDLFSLDSGYDFTVTVSPTDKTFNGFVVKEIKLLPRRKSSKLFGKKEQVEAVMKTMPDFDALFRAQVKNAEELMAIRDNFITAQSASGEGAGSSDENGTYRGDDGKAIKEVDAAFSDIG